MNNTLRAAALIIMAASAIIAAATSRHSRAYKQHPYEWEESYSYTDSFSALQHIKFSNSNHK